MRALRSVVLLALFLTLVVTAPHTASAQSIPGCSPGRPIEDEVSTAPAVFIGTVAETRDEGREVTVDVIRVWRGGPLPPKVEVRGTVATQSKVHTALDRSYAKGATYLFVPPAGIKPRFIENACSGTTILTGALAALAPPGGGDLPAGISDGTPTGTDYGRWAPLAIGGVAFVALGSLLLAARRKGRRALKV